jgi:precorrin-2 dehydrogenase / sirohydrochlorin ferrochelatase
VGADAPAPYYPMFLNLAGRTVVVVGAGVRAERKAASLLRYGADVVVIAAEATQRLREMEVEGLITLEPREYATGDLEGVALVISAGASLEVSRHVARDANMRGCPFNVASNPELSNYLIPTSLRRGPLQIAISTSGAAPSVAKRLRDELKATYGEEWGTYVALLGAVRALAFDRIADSTERDRVLDEVAAEDFLSRIAAGETLDAESVFAQFAPPPLEDEPPADVAEPPQSQQPEE